MLIALTLNSIAFTTSYGFITTITQIMGDIKGKVILAQSGSKAIYTSMVPQSLAESLNRIDGVNVQSVILSPTTISGEPIVFRGVSSIQSYRDKVIYGAVPNTEGLWFMVGDKAYNRLNLKIGEIIPVGNPRNSRVLLLKLVAVYRTGDLRDWEAVVPLSIGRALTNLPEGVINIIEVEGVGKSEVEKLVGKSYNLTINHDLQSGAIYILDSLNTPVECIKINAPGTESLLLPFGYYSLVYQESYLVLNITSLLLSRNRDINLTFKRDKLFKVTVYASKEESPIIQLQNGSEVHGEWMDGAWIFSVPGGLHKLTIYDSSYPLPVLEDVVFNPTIKAETLHRITLKVFTQDGVELNGYLVIVKDKAGNMVFSRSSSTHKISFLLPQGEYSVEVMKPPYKTDVTLKVSGDMEVKLKLPVILSLHKVPLTLYRKVEAYTQLDRSNASLQTLLGLSSEVLLASTLTLLALSVIAIFTIQEGLYNASKYNIKILTQLGAGRLQFLRIIGLPILLLNIVVGLTAGWFTFTLNKLYFHQLTIFGYGMETPFTISVMYSVTLSILSWLYSTLKNFLFNKVEK